jgi:hypothetical protein
MQVKRCHTHLFHLSQMSQFWSSLVVSDKKSGHRNHLSVITWKKVYFFRSSASKMPRETWLFLMLDTLDFFLCQKIIVKGIK